MTAGEREPRPADVEEALDVVTGIIDAIEDVPERSKDRASDYFESVEERARSIGQTIERTNAVTPNQRNALDNMLKGVRKWLHDD